MTHILAIALVIDDLVTDTHDVRDDLHLDNKEWAVDPCLGPVANK